MFRRWFYGVGGVMLATVLLVSIFWTPALWSLAVPGPLLALGMYDPLQTRRTILRNFPLLGRFRYLFELVRPELQQ